MKKIIGILFFFVLVLTSCYYDKEDLLYGSSTVDCNTISAKFSTDISPIIQTKCATTGCHNAAGAAGGVTLLNYTQVKASVGRIQQRCLILKDMPPGNPLTQIEQDKLKCWIQGGALNN
jgi:uncharacterized membrane protein